MNESDMHIQWQDGSGESVEIGYLNPNGQQCCGHCEVPGTDMHDRLCPECQKGAPGIRYWRIIKR